MADFAVDMDVLNGFLTSLKNSDDNLQAAMRSLAETSAASIGTERLDEAADHFRSTWNYGVKQIGQSIDNTSKAVTGIRDCYQEADGDLAKAMDKMSSAL